LEEKVDSANGELCPVVLRELEFAVHCACEDGFELVEYGLGR
jgi:hypothetical protein